MNKIELKPKFTELSELQQLLLYVSNLSIESDDDAIIVEDFALALFERVNDGVDYLRAIYLRVLDILRAYETTQSKIKGTGVQALKYLMEDRGDTQTSLSNIISRTVLSEILSGKRNLNLNHIKALAKKYNVPEQVFIDEAV
ncbi:MAG: helix-turn-helix domain-containing protein [Spirochaetaceae bacterium]